MARKRFRWTRKLYRRAAWMSRFMGRHTYDLPERPPPLLQRYFDLWDRHPQRDDPLTTHISQRRQPHDGIPF